MIGSLIEAQLFGSMQEDEENDYDHMLIDDSSAHVVTRKIVVLEKNNLNMCKGDATEMELM